MGHRTTTTEAAMAEHEVPDLSEVAEKIHAAHDAETQLMHTMPNAIHPDDDAYDGMTGPSEGDVEKVKGDSPSEHEGSGERRDDDEEAFVEAAVVEDDSAPPDDPDHA
jgi:hypothetical protein